jgi:hypothetical protein
MLLKFKVYLNKKKGSEKMKKDDRVLREINQKILEYQELMRPLNDHLLRLMVCSTPKIIVVTGVNGEQNIKYEDSPDTAAVKKQIYEQMTEVRNTVFGLSKSIFK